MEKIILDCDPGHDDAIAILLAAGNPKIDLLGITTVSGNHNVENTTRNALSVCTAYGIKVPVAKGSPGPLIIDQVLAVEIHGDTGLDGPVLPPASFELDKRHAVDFIIDTVMAHEPKTITLVPVGPYTNIALAVRKEPRIVSQVKRVVAMGGSFTRGNITPAAEFNIYADPEAADVVFRAAWDVTMVGLDLTHQAQATPDLQDRVRAVGGPIARFILDIWAFIATTHGGLLQIAYPAVHDACCVAAMIDGSVFITEKADIRVEIAGRWTKGMTVCNFEKMGGMRHFGGTASEQTDFRHTVAMKLDHAKFCDLVVDALERLTKAKG
ncbi:nucleoside hydrolase [Mesorhizobium amorphae]|uniref:Inosine-uridine preferring nucleoside hydrolase n=1 Tax=Mesorhizobium amorphae CCNWGS0123 TaxID=1082933 RepID=G6YC47_9HYPH|nr:nucleoside hydrolase [Mesorhizobium amorphae]ANT51304.1 ribonucleoside hydrolase [Mesorhizobium amorphae CCNWGS0123]EHH10721.1 inosine-uridine preferring nucleoside hydrolase [Mesorhizobium amorphae CCNWGS0123]GLR45121.1 ribosylpyrimidine nucleosidase [Mesorhizobium amorphae]